jgi:2-methylisocitrate lyase-like PEP mutase family enzyme
MTPATRLRALLKAEAMVIAPGAYDGITARLIAQAGFPAVYMTGAGTAASYGYPDFGLVTMTEMVANAARIVRAVDVPVSRRRRHRLRQRVERGSHDPGA